MKTPIVLTAYNRPEYFKKVLHSVSSQCWDRKVYCVVDGPRFKEDVDLVKKSFELSKEMIPHCETFIAKSNQGVARIMKYARELVFKDNDFLILIEDDSVLAPHYIQQLDFLIEKFRDDERIAMINCFGEHHRSKKSYKYSYINYLHDSDDRLPIKMQEDNKDKLVLMDHLWAYAMRKSSYEKIYDILEKYWNLLPEEYRFRPHKEILDLMSSIGADPNKIVSSQDSCTSAAFAARGMIKISTLTNNFKYIG
jgi:glycosyltransferase involved in cell wall biosynthesis